MVNLNISYEKWRQLKCSLILNKKKIFGKLPTKSFISSYSPCLLSCSPFHDLLTNYNMLQFNSQLATSQQQERGWISDFQKTYFFNDIKIKSTWAMFGWFFGLISYSYSIRKGIGTFSDCQSNGPLLPNHPWDTVTPKIRVTRSSLELRDYCQQINTKKHWTRALNKFHNNEPT